MNDPFDTHGEIINRFPLFKETIKYKGLNVDTYPTVLDTFGICCFSEELLNKHLWAFYGDSYKGWCLEFDDEEFENNLSAQESCNVVYNTVHYLQQWPNLDDFDIHIPLDNNVSKPVSLLIREIGKDSEFLFEYIMLIKEEGTWLNEKEKRILLGLRYAKLHPEQVNDNGYKLNWPKGILKRIIVGHNITSIHLDTIKRIAKCKQVPLFITKTIDSGLGFEMEIVEIKLD